MSLKGRLRLQLLTSILSGFLSLLTILWPDWIELVLRVHPDQSGGALEWAVCASLASAAGLLALASGRTGRLLAASRG